MDKSLFSLPGIKRLLLLLAGTALLSGLAVLGYAWSLSSAITNLWQGETFQDQFMWVALFLLCFIGIQVIATFQDSLLDTYAYQQADRLRKELMRTLFTKGSEVVQQSGTGNVTTMLLEGIEQVETYLHLILPKLTRILMIPLVLLIAVFTLDWVSGVVLVIVFPFIILYMVILGRMAGEKAAKQHKKYQVLSNHFIDSLRGIETLKFFGISKKHGESIYSTSEEFRKATIKTLRVATLSSLVLDLFATLSLAAVAILLGLRLLDGSLVLFPALTILVLSPEYFKPIREFASDFHSSLDGRNALKSIQKTIADYRQASSSDEAQNGKPLLLPWNESACIELNSLGYSYGQFEALHNISCAVTGFTKVGIIGASGAGKSTLIQLLGGFAAASEGAISINGLPVSSLEQPGWQKQVAYLPQDPYIFHATLAENICFYHPEATRNEIAQAVAVVGLQDLVDELPLGLDTKIGEGERALSGGQAQRVALARVCLDKSRSILLFDEPTAHLDIETELELKQRMLPLMHNHLVFFATHRLHWMHDMDLILVLEGGAIVERGTLTELSAQDGYFASLVKQMRGGTL